MTILATKRERDALGIDTFERAFVYAALLLRAANTAPLPSEASLYRNSVRIVLDLDNIGVNGLEPLVIIQATIPYISQVALKSAANFVENLDIYGASNPNPFTAASPPTNPNRYPITTEPEWVNTLEKYLAWAGSSLLLRSLKLDPRNKPSISLSILEEAVKPSLQIDASLQFDINIYLSNNNLIAALRQKVQSLNNGVELINEVAVGNRSNTGNDSTVGN